MDNLKIDNQLCFLLYVSSKELVRKYQPLLDELDLTYTQYITMLVLWEQKELNVKTLGEVLSLDSGTLTPILKKLEAKNYIIRKRSVEDERNVIISLTEDGIKLKNNAIEIPTRVSSCIDLTPEEGLSLYKLLKKLSHSLLDK